MYHVSIDGRVVYKTNDYSAAKRQFKRVRSAYTFHEVLIDLDGIICD